MDSFIQTFHIDWKILIAQTINFVVIIGFIYYLTLKPIKKLMNERTERIEKGINDAKTNAELLDKTQKEYNSILSKARIEANQIFQDGKKEAENNKNQILESTKQEVKVMVASGKKVLESEKVKMIEEAKNEIVSLVVTATEKLLELNPDESFNEKILQKMNK